MREIKFFNRRNKGLNIDITHRCALECPRCQRQTFFRDRGKKVYGVDISLEDIKKLAAFYKCFDFCGQLSDPVHHPKFIEILAYLRSVNVKCYVHNASSAKSLDWYIKAWKANTSATWIFGIDGLPKDSHKYRVNQDGNLVWKQMKNGAKNGNEIMWQYIVFSYNENDIEEAKSMAEDNNIIFRLIESSRWRGEDDPLRPSKHFINRWF